MGSNWKHAVTVYTKIAKLFYVFSMFLLIIPTACLPVTRNMFKWNFPAWKWLQDFAQTPQGSFLEFPAALWLLGVAFFILAVTINIFDHYYRKSRKDDFAEGGRLKDAQK